MAVRRNPPHDRVFLSSEERREFARCVHALLGMHSPLDTRTRPGWLGTVRHRSTAVLVAVAGRSRWLISVGAILMLAALVPPVMLVVVGASVTSLGAASGLVARRAGARCRICRDRRG